jgi:bifunctional non-homologous end joining protein LigD
MRSFPVHYIAFDLLFLEGHPLMEQPLWKRKNLLHAILKPSEAVQACEFIEADGKAFFQATCEHGLEGIMAKEKGSPYIPGRRSSSWLKIKRMRDCDFVVGGYSFGGRRKELFSSLLLGLYDRGELIYMGHVGTGFSDSDLKRVYSLLQQLHIPACPFRDVPRVQKFIYWCRPEVVCQVRYGEFTPDGKLRYPVFLGLREDKLAKDCVVTDAPGWPRARESAPGP